MFTYYKNAGALPADCDIEAMIGEMRPWYDNYCFAKECLKDNNRVFNSDMVLFYLRNYMMYKSSPEVNQFRPFAPISNYRYRRFG